MLMRKTIAALTVAIALSGTAVHAVASPGSINEPATAYAPATRLRPPTQGVTVTKITDGDTIRIAELDQPIRILGYDTPEIGECGYDEATQRLAQILGSGTVTVTTDNGDNTDRYGRYLRHVLVNGVPVGLTMISEGKANARYDSLDGYPRHRYQDQYRAADGPNTFTCIPTQPPPPTSGSEPWNQPISASNPDLDCGDIRMKVWITGIDYHGLDRDNDGWGCESYG
jgi:endonuclease YncB( thermonuclease family)